MAKNLRQSPFNAFSRAGSDPRCPFEQAYGVIGYFKDLTRLWQTVFNLNTQNLNSESNSVVRSINSAWMLDAITLESTRARLERSVED